jgi:tRNA threonylcarbamoyladenosine biosynthesis protein TsaE
MEMQVVLNDLNTFSEAFWNYVKTARVFAWHGQMGAGKTTLITALGKWKGVEDAMSSPTFSLINQYVYYKDGDEQLFYHIDLYRLNSPEEAMRAGVEDAIYSGAICMVEWPEKAPQLFDAETVHVFIEPIDATQRSVRIELPNSRNL